MLEIDSSFCSTIVRSKAHLSNQLAVIFVSLWPRFEKRRVQEELEALNTKLTRLSSHHEGGPAVELLQEEIKGYKTIIKCGVCHDRNKEVLLWTHTNRFPFCYLGDSINICHFIVFLFFFSIQQPPFHASLIIFQPDPFNFAT